MKKKSKGGGGGANWMDTYGDMVTLLLCFFVLLYSMSTISEEKYKAIVLSFNPNAVETPTATPGGDGPSADPEQGEGMLEMDQAQVDAQIDDLYEKLKEYVSSQQGTQGEISVTRGDGKVFIPFNQSVFFDGDSPVLREESLPVLDSVSEMLSAASDAIDEVRVLGHTAQADPNAINNPKKDRTLASQRATNVVIYVQEHSTLDPARLVSEGIGQWRPIADNSTSEGRAKNRRVEMIVSGRNIEEELKNGIQQFET